MMRYWLQKQSQLFAGEPEYLQQLFYAAIRVASMLNQYNTLAVIMADDELFPLLREIYSREDTVDSRIRRCFAISRLLSSSTSFSSSTRR